MKKQPNPVVSIVIPCWNQLTYTEICVDSILRNTRQVFELILVDNGSTDQTPNYLKKMTQKHGNVRVIRNSHNKGYGFACNQGMAVARGEHVLILNNDTVVPPNWLQPMLAPMAQPEIGIVGPRTNNISGPQCLQDVPYGDDLKAMERYASALSEEKAGTGFFINRAVGFCLLIKRELVERIGGFDLNFGLGNFEDDDLCLRAQIAGYKIWIANDAFIHHFGSRTFAGQRIDYAALMRRNQAIFFTKWRVPLDTTSFPLQTILAAPFDPTLHYVPLTSERLAVEASPPIQLQESRQTHFLLWPDWTNPNDRWPEALAAFLRAFNPDDPVGLVVRIDPMVEPDSNAVIRLFVVKAAEMGLNLEMGHMILVLNDLVPPRYRNSVYKTANFFIDTGETGKFSRNREEAEACSLNLCQPDARSMQAACGMPLSAAAGPSAEQEAKSPQYYEMVNPGLVQAIKDARGKRFLEIGCASGKLGEYFKASGAAYYVGVEYVPHVAEIARTRLDEVYAGDIQTIDLPLESESFDYLVLGDVLEHLVDPWSVLSKCSRFLKPSGYVVASIPNINHISIFVELLSGRWTYAEAGLLDKTHLRFFTLTEIQKLFVQAGLALTEATSVVLPNSGLDALSADLNLIRQKYGLGSERFGRELNAYQWIIKATRDPQSQLVRK